MNVLKGGHVIITTECVQTASVATNVLAKVDFTYYLTREHAEVSDFYHSFHQDNLQMKFVC